MTLGEKLDILNKSVALKKSGDLEGSNRLIKSVPLPPYLAKIAKEKIGLDFLINGGWNLSEVEAEFGHSFLSN
ncbi:hypothetical protein R84B8_02470 [Treponema sp. R8-4-B8]